VSQEDSHALILCREAAEVEQKAQSLHEAKLDETLRRLLAKEEAERKAKKEKLLADFKEHIKERLLESNQSMGGSMSAQSFLAVAEANSNSSDYTVSYREMQNHDARALISTRKTYSFMNMDAIATTKDMFDIDSMADGMKKDMAANVKALQGHVDSMKAYVKKAKDNFEADRKSIRDNYKSCKKEMKRNKHGWKTSAQCSPFAGHFSSLLEVEQEDEAMIQDGDTSSRRRRDDRRRDSSRRRRESHDEKKKEKDDKKDEKKQEKKQKKAAKCSERPDCEIRQAAHQSKQQAKADYDKVASTAKDWSKQLRQAKFQGDILPAVIIIIKPFLIEAFKAYNITTPDCCDGMLKACGQGMEAGGSGCIPMMEIQAVSLLKSYLSLQLNAFLSKELGKLFDAIEKDIWKIFNPLMKAVQNAIVGEVGEIPFVGGVLAVAVNVLFSTLYGVIRKAVDGALDTLETLLQADIVKGIVDAIMDIPLFSNSNLIKQSSDSATADQLSDTMDKTSDSESKKHMSKNQKKVSDKQKKEKGPAQKKAKGKQSGITKAGNSASQDDQKDTQESNEVVQSEDQKDIDDDTSDS
jgi:hypothetical protein